MAKTTTCRAVTRITNRVILVTVIPLMAVVGVLDPYVALYGYIYLGD